jgi:hypothetical protein
MAWTLQVQVVDRTTRTALRRAAIYCVGGLAHTDADGRASLVILEDSVAWVVVTIHLQGYVVTQDVVLDRGEKVIELDPLPAGSAEIGRPHGLHVSEWSSDSVTCVWTDPISYSRHVFRWRSTSAGEDGQMELGGADVRVSVDRAVTRGERFRFRVQGGIGEGFGRYRDSAWAEFEWVVPPPDSPPNTWSWQIASSPLPYRAGFRPPGADLVPD